MIQIILAVACGWFLMANPGSSSSIYESRSEWPTLPKWEIAKAFDTAKECENDLDQRVLDGVKNKSAVILRCIPADQVHQHKE